MPRAASLHVFVKGAGVDSPSLVSPNLPASPPSPAFSSRCSNFSRFPVSSASSQALPTTVSTVPCHSENRCTALAPRSAILPDRISSDEPSLELLPLDRSRENSPGVCSAQSRAVSQTGFSQSHLSSPPQSAKSHWGETQTSAQSHPRFAW